jgi:hypothetical protein
MNDSYTHKKGLVYKNQFHIIFCSKYRRPVLVDGVDERLKEILFSAASDFDASIKYNFPNLLDYSRIFSWPASLSLRQLSV